jgi:hypothetical protein
VNLTVMILRAGLRLPGHRDRPEAWSASCLTGPTARAPALDRWLFPSPLPRAKSRGHVTRACAGRVFKARVAQGLPYRSHITLTDRADITPTAELHIHRSDPVGGTQP